jgi:surfactin synthase thioesterase subunit
MLCCCAPTSKQLLTVEQPGREAHSQTSPISDALSLAAAADAADDQAASEAAALSTKGEEVAIKVRGV